MAPFYMNQLRKLLRGVMIPQWRPLYLSNLAKLTHVVSIDLSPQIPFPRSTAER